MAKTFPITYPNAEAPTSIPTMMTPYSVRLVPAMSPNPTVEMVVKAQYSEIAYLDKTRGHRRADIT